MKSKIINRVRDQQEKARAFRFWQCMQALADAEGEKTATKGDDHIRLVKQTLTHTFKQPTRHWWQFWK